MKSLVISLGGAKASRLVDILTYYSRRLESQLFVEVYDINGKEITDAKITITKDFDQLSKDETSSKFTASRLKVSKDGYQPVDTIVRVKAEQISTARVILAKERSLFLVTTVFLTLLAPFIWAIIKYTGAIINAPLVNFFYLATIIAGLQFTGAMAGIRLISTRLEGVLHNRYYSGVIGILIGELVAILIFAPIITFFAGHLLNPTDIVIIVVLMVVLALAGLIIDQNREKFLDKTRFTSSLFVSLGAMIGGFLSNSLWSQVEKIIGFFQPVVQAVDLSIYFPFIVGGFTIAWCNLLVYHLKKRGFIRHADNLSSAIYSLLGVIVIAALLPVIAGKDIILLPFLLFSTLGGLGGLILHFLLFGRSLEESDVSSIREGAGLMKRYRLSIVPLSIETVRSRLETLRFVSAENILFFDEPNRDAVSFFNTDLKERIHKKITNIYRNNLRDCNRLFSSFVVVIDLRDNNLCEMLPLVLSFLRKEYAIPVYAVVISSEKSLNRNWLKKVIDLSDAVIPVDYHAFEDILYLDRFIHQEEEDLVMEDIYEEGCVVEFIQRFAPLLEVNERDSPSGLDVSHVARLLSRSRIPDAVCNEISDVLIPSKQNVVTCGFFSLNKKKCQEITLELGMGEYLDYALRNPLWTIERSLCKTRAMVIVRARREDLVTGLVKTWMSSIYNGTLVITGDLVQDADDHLEIIILVSNILEEVKSDPSNETRCSEIPQEETAQSPGVIRKFWHKLIDKEIPESDDAEGRYRWGSPDAYTAIIKKYYNRSPILRYQAVTIAREHPGPNQWEQAKAICEWVRDTIRYVSDPYGSEYIQLPEETLNIEGGDCDDQAVLLASLLMCIGFRCSLVFTSRHVYVAVYLPSAPDSFRTYPRDTWPDQSSARDWIGFDSTCSNCSFGELPESDKKIEMIAVVA